MKHEPDLWGPGVAYYELGRDHCPVCGDHVFITGQTRDGRLIGACGDAFSPMDWSGGTGGFPRTIREKTGQAVGTLLGALRELAGGRLGLYVRLLGVALRLLKAELESARRCRDQDEALERGG